jgi:hypothetical protein
LENGLLKEISKLVKGVSVDDTYTSVQIYKGTHKNLTKNKFQDDEEKIIKEENKHIQRVGSQEFLC